MASNSAMFDLLNNQVLSEPIQLILNSSLLGNRKRLKFDYQSINLKLMRENNNK